MVKQNDTDGGQDASDIEALAPLIKAYIDKHVQDAIKQHEDSQSKPKKWRNSWRSASPITKASLILSAFVALSTIAYTVAAWQTLIVMREISSDGAQQTEKLIDAASQIKSAAWNFKGSAQGIDGNLGNAVGKLQDQADQVKRSAAASEKAASIANETLHVSERAYLFLKSPQFDATTATLFLPIENLGHLPATNVHVIVHVLRTSKTADGGENAVFNWFQRDFSEVWFNEPLSIGGVSNIDMARTQKGENVYTFGATIEYSDGFPDSKRQKREVAYCMSHLINDHIGYGPCLVTNTLDLLKHGDQYPSPKYQIP